MHMSCELDAYLMLVRRIAIRKHAEKIPEYITLSHCLLIVK